MLDMSTKKHSLDAITTRLSDGSFVQKAFSDLKMAYWLMKQPDVSLLSKLIPVAIVIYTLIPVDFIPDIIPVLGQIDDVALIMLGVRAFLRLASPAVVGRYEASLATNTNDTSTENEVAITLLEDGEDENS